MVASLWDARLVGASAQGAIIGQPALRAQ